MTTYYCIQNDWDDRTFCALDQTWINDGRSTATFKSINEAEEAFSLLPNEDKPRCEITKMELENIEDLE